MSCELDASDLLINRGKEVTFEEAGKAMLRDVELIGAFVESIKDERLMDVVTLDGPELIVHTVIFPDH